MATQFSVFIKTSFISGLITDPNTMPGAVIQKNPKLEAVYDILIDDGGRFKYILCKVYDPETPEDSKIIVRGMKTADFHCMICIMFNIIEFTIHAYLNALSH